MHYFERVARPRRRELDERLAMVAAAVGGTRFTIRFPGRVQARILAGDALVTGEDADLP